MVVPQVGGHVIAHASTIRLSLRKGKAEQRIMKVPYTFVNACKHA